MGNIIVCMSDRQKRLRRCSTVRTLCGQDYVKDLSRLGRSLGRTVLVDNGPYSGLLQPCNLLPTNAYYGESSDRWPQHLCHLLINGRAVVKGCFGGLHVLRSAYVIRM